MTRANIIVDANGEFYANVESGLEGAIYDAERPCGPFVCTVCTSKYDELTRQEGYAMNEYTIVFSICGEITLRADSEEAAIEKLEKISQRDLLDDANPAEITELYRNGE